VLYKNGSMCQHYKFNKRGMKVREREPARKSCLFTVSYKILMVGF